MTKDDLQSDEDDLADDSSPLPEAVADQTDNSRTLIFACPTCQPTPRSAEPLGGHAWRQACQILFAQFLDRRKPWEILKNRARRCGP